MMIAMHISVHKRVMKSRVQKGEPGDDRPGEATSEASRSCLVDGYQAETQRATCTNGTQTSPVAGAEPREVMPLVSYRASTEPVLHEIREVAGHTQSAKQLPTPQSKCFAKK